MKIFDFDIEKGIYHFEFNDLNTENHSHPVVEIINAKHGTFSLEVNGHSEKNLVFAIIDSNIEHKVVSKNGQLRILMVESHNPLLFLFFESKAIRFENGAFSRANFYIKNELMEEVIEFARTTDLKTPVDKRVADCIKFIEQNELEYKNLLSHLTSKAFLSESRLSHLFKEHIGVSIKKYLVWNKLKQAINLYLEEPDSLTSVSLESGFFDQAHLSNSFKNVLGVSPSRAYNSRTLQA
ncbi:helix-turn-helix domain-containing protein [Flagellimonas sp.]|uniref:AraC family transcriptional regulator n=1 Tax=Flagellimonas sp. TaxID=2058762 RepID=UPI003F4A70CF